MQRPDKRKKLNELLERRLAMDTIIESKFQPKDMMSQFENSMNRKLELFENHIKNSMIKADEFNGIRIPIRGKTQVKYANQELRMVQETKNSLNNFITEMYPNLNPPRKKISH